MTTILLKSHKITNGGLELLNLFSRFCVSSTLFYSTMNSYSEQKETEFWESLNNDSFTPHFDVDNFAIKKHNLRDHTESMTRICTLLAVGKVDVSDLLRLWGNTDFNFSFEYFSLTSVDELSFLNECNNNVSKFDTLKKKKVPKKRVLGSDTTEDSYQSFHCLPQQIPALSSSDYDCFKICYELDKKINDNNKYLRILSSDQQIIEKYLRFQKDGFFTNWIF